MALRRYRNRGRNSGVSAYETGEDYIKIEFVDGDLYLYTDASAGPETIARMKQLAASGEGLSTFISQRVRDRYAARLR